MRFPVTGLKAPSLRHMRQEYPDLNAQLRHSPLITTLEKQPYLLLTRARLDNNVPLHHSAIDSGDRQAGVESSKRNSH